MSNRRLEETSRSTHCFVKLRIPGEVGPKCILIFRQPRLTSFNIFEGRVKVRVPSIPCSEWFIKVTTLRLRSKDGPISCIDSICLSLLKDLYPVLRLLFRQRWVRVVDALLLSLNVICSYKGRQLGKRELHQVCRGYGSWDRKDSLLLDSRF